MKSVSNLVKTSVKIRCSFHVFIVFIPSFDSNLERLDPRDHSVIKVAPVRLRLRAASRSNREKKFHHVAFALYAIIRSGGSKGVI